MHEFLAGLADVADRGGVTNLQKLNFLMSVVAGINPRDQLESMLAAHMGAVHIAIMKSARSLANAATPAEVESHGRTLIKLTRTFATLMETLQRYRSTRDQKVMLQTVSPSVATQAIAENVQGQSEPDSSPALLPILHESEGVNRNGGRS